MQLSKAGLADRKQWEEKGYRLPQFDREQMVAATKEAPYWVHFGAGNLFRAFQANVAQNLLNEGVLDRGIVVAEGYDYEIVEKMNRPHDDYSILVTLKADGSVEKTVVGSVAESLALDSENETDFGRLKEIFTTDSLQMASFTITEKGYSLVNGKGETLADVAEDFVAGPEKARSYIGKVSALLYARYQAGEKPVAMVSMDNCSHNGTKLYDAVHTFAETWVKNGVAEAGFVAYIENPDKGSFPWTMIDKITPRPDSSVEEILKNDGVEELEPVITSKNSYVAPFVNAEECEYLVIEDRFPNGRPELEKGGLMFTTRETVDKVEKMKVCTCLNPLHTTLAVFGCLPDTPQRIATDTSQKLAIRFGETIKAYEAGESLNTADLKLIPLVFAGWLRYLMGVDDNGKTFDLSPDPLLETVCPYVAGFKLGEETDVEASVRPILENKAIFGVNLYEVNMAETVCGYLKEMLAGTGAVRNTLEKYVR